MMIVMTNEQKREYMNKKIVTAMHYIRTNQYGFAGACLNDYDAKIGLGWPSAEEHLIEQLCETYPI